MKTESIVFYATGGLPRPGPPALSSVASLQGPGPQIHKKNSMPASKIMRKAIRNNKNNKVPPSAAPQGGGRFAPAPLGLLFFVFLIAFLMILLAGML